MEEPEQNRKNEYKVISYSNRYKKNHKVKELNESTCVYHQNLVNYFDFFFFTLEKLLPSVSANLLNCNKYLLLIIL